MCSGCAGGFDDESDWEQGDDEMAQCNPEVFWSYLRERKRMHRREPEQADHALPDLEDYEVLVSAERIVERRTIRAKCFVGNEKAGFKAAAESPGERKQSRSVSAKNYQTLSILREKNGPWKGAARKCLISRYLAMLAAVAGMLWWAAR